jgi:hypothetical protein
MIILIIEQLTLPGVSAGDILRTNKKYRGKGF